MAQMRYDLFFARAGRIYFRLMASECRQGESAVLRRRDLGEAMLSALRAHRYASAGSAMARVLLATVGPALSRALAA